MLTINRNEDKLPAIDTLFIPDIWFSYSKHNTGDLNIDFFKKADDKSIFIQYEYYIRCIKKRAKAYLKLWIRKGYSLEDLIFSGIFDNHACLNRQGMEQLRYESLLGKHYL